MAKRVGLGLCALSLIPFVLQACAASEDDDAAALPPPFSSSPGAQPANTVPPAAVNTAPTSSTSPTSTGSPATGDTAGAPPLSQPAPQGSGTSAADDDDDDMPAPTATQPPPQPTQPPPQPTQPPPQPTQPPPQPTQPPPQPTQPPPQSSCVPFPAATGNRNVSATIDVSGTFDGGLVRFIGTGPLGNGTQEEGQDALFELAPGSTLRNVILGSPAADGIHCQGACTLENVWWEDVGEDAATFRGNNANQTMTVRCAGARGADDKVLQQNGAGTLTIQDFTVEDFGKLYRSCGNCSTQFARHVVLRNITARNGDLLVGINSNLGDTATFENVTLFGDIGICDRFNGNNTGAEPTKIGSGPDGRSCVVDNGDIIQR